jgi:uncharacterized membrane protein SpoIIM required for sporulation
MTAPLLSPDRVANPAGGLAGRELSACDRFLLQRRETWAELSLLLTSKASLHKLPAERIARVAALYREVCTDRMRAEHLGCPPDVTTHLDHLVARAHNALYSSRRFSVRGAVRFALLEFPRALRANWGPFVWANLLFWGPFALGLVGSLESQQFAAGILPAHMLEAMAEAYSEGFAAGRDGATNAAMAGFYVYNNVGIAFRCFATGILFGIGSVFFLLYNGLVTGAVVGHVIRTGGGPNILTFVAGHAPLELTAIVIAGAAGLQMGRALVVTGGLTRLGSLWTQRHSLAAQIVGAALMLLGAAAIEGFWSPSSVPPPVKWAFGAVLFLLVASYLALAGRPRRARGDQSSDPVRAKVHAS